MNIKIPFFQPRQLSSYEVVTQEATDLMKYNVELLKDQVKNLTEELIRTKKENEELKESLRMKQESVIPATVYPNPALTKTPPKITSIHELTSRLEAATRRK